jgi:tRNA (guanosine-2'-O-)-methyltransferase
MKGPGEQRLKRFAEVAAKRQRGLILVLEDMWDPHNAAATLRCADAFGVQEVWYVFEKQKYFNPKKIGSEASSSAGKWLTFRVFRKTADCVRELKRKKYTIAATALDPRAVNLYRTTLSTYQNLALVMGNEHSGISEEMKKKANILLTLPMRGFVDSLNLGVATAVFLAEITRQRESSQKISTLTAGEQKKLVKDFASR